LIIDDLGAEFVTQFSISALYNLINTRQNKGLSTIISTNLSGSELAGKYEGRIYSRIIGADYTVLRFEGKDQRIAR
jgi:DNA replication protein DnaC